MWLKVFSPLITLWLDENSVKMSAAETKLFCSKHSSIYGFSRYPLSQDLSELLILSRGKKAHFKTGLSLIKRETEKNQEGKCYNNTCLRGDNIVRVNVYQ